MTTIYLVTSGDYSAYNIAGVYDNLELAELALRRISDGRIEEWELNLGADALRSGMDLWRIYFRETGDIREVRREEYGVLSTEPHVSELRQAGLMVSVVARDEDHARKTATDMRAEYLATKAGVS